MLKVTLANLRAHASRFVAVSIAVMLAVAFMSATLLLSASTKATFRATLGEEVQHADLVLDSVDSEMMRSTIFTDDTIADLRELPGVAAVDGRATLPVTVSSATRNEPYTWLTSLMDPALEPQVIAEGRLPESPDEVVLDTQSMAFLEVEVGDTLTLTSPDVMAYDGEAETDEELVAANPTTVTITGVLQDSKNPFNFGGVNIFATKAGVTDLASSFQTELYPYDKLLLTAEPGVSLDEVSATLGAYEFEADEQAVIERYSDGTPRILTPDEIVGEQINSFTNETDVLTAVLLAFVGVALFVAGLVISNTFSVLVAQRSRELALLRCVGASTTQIRRSVLLEALVMALIASFIGVALAFGIMSGLIWVVSVTGFTDGIGAFGWNVQAILLPILAGVLVTLIAAQGPAREATRVAPIEAMRSKSAETLTRSAGRVRLTVGLVFLILGLLIVAGGAVAGRTINEPVLSLLIVLVGSMISAVGILMLAIFVIPRITHRLGKLLSRRNVTGRLAAVNTARNPKRTAATAGALLVGVTLVATVYTGAEVARATFTSELSDSFPVDMTAVIYDEEDGEADRVTHLDTLRAIDGVDIVVPAKMAYVSATATNVSSDYDPASEYLLDDFLGMDPADYDLVTRGTPAILTNGHIILEKDHITEVTVTGDAGSLPLTVINTGAPRGTGIVTLEDFERIAGTQEQDPEDGSEYGPDTWVALIKVEPHVSTQEMLDIRDELANLVPLAYVTGEGVERALFEQIISILLLIVTALLAVAVIIAIIGIGNTLSLSVIERTRENALLRALGLTRTQLRSMLAKESLLTALTTAILGVALGIMYGFAGSTAILGTFERGVKYELPWIPFAIIIVAALAAGLLASVMPARRALKASPVEALRGAA